MPNKRSNSFLAGFLDSRKILGMITIGFSIFNFLIDVFDWTISPILGPLVTIYNEWLIDQIIRLRERFPHLMPDWNPHYIAFIYIMVIAIFRVMEHEESEDGQSWIRSLLMTVALPVWTTIILVIPGLRELLLVFVINGAWAWSMTGGIINNQPDDRGRLMAAFGWGSIVGALSFLAVNTFSNAIAS